MNTITYSEARATIIADTDVHGLALPSCTKGIYFYKGSKGVAVKLGDDAFVVVDANSLTAKWLLSYGQEGVYELDSKSNLVDYADFEYTYERFGYKQNEYCSDHVVYVSNGYNFICDYRTDLDNKQAVYTAYMNARSQSKNSLFDVVNKLSNGKAKQVSREDKIRERYERDISIGATTLTLSQYEESMSHENLRDLYIETEESLTPEEINYANFNEPVWSMTKANTTFYNNSSAL